MCLVQIDIRSMWPVPVELVAEDPFWLEDRIANWPVRGGTRRMSDLGWPWPVDLGPTVTEALERNKRAWIVAKHLGQLNRSGMHGCQNLEDILFRRQILLFFLQKECQVLPRQMLHIAGGLPV